MKKLRIDRERLKMLMEREGIPSFRQLGKVAGVHPNTLVRILDGEAWNSETIQRLAEALKCNPIDLQVADGYPDPNWEALAVPLTS